MDIMMTEQHNAKFVIQSAKLAHHLPNVHLAFLKITEPYLMVNVFVQMDFINKFLKITQ